MSDPVSARLKEIQRKYFALLDEFFVRATGESWSQFAEPETFSFAVRSKAQLIASRGPSAYKWADENLPPFFAGEGMELFRLSREVGGLKLVHGGMSSLSPGSLRALRSVLLYADTVLVSDPVLPWFERKRLEERFRHVRFLQEAFHLLQLKPIIDADLAEPPVVVFPSWEKSLEDNDETTQAGVNHLLATVLGAATGRDFENMETLRDFVVHDPSRFLEVVEKKHLFVPPGAEIGEPLTKSLSKYHDYVATWRSADYQAAVAGAENWQIVMELLTSRVTHQYHLLENAFELRAQPLLTVAEQEHYFKLCAASFQETLAAKRLLSPQTSAALHSLQAKRNRWLGRVPFREMVELRKTGATAEFREKVRSAVGDLESVGDPSDLDRVVANVARTLATMLDEHEAKAQQITEKYRLKHKLTAVGGWLSAAATLMPALETFMAVSAPLTVAGKYAVDKLSERKERRDLRKSLIGVLASASAKDDMVKQ